MRANMLRPFVAAAPARAPSRRYLDPVQGPDAAAIEALLAQEDDLIGKLQLSRDAFALELFAAPADTAADYQGYIEQIERFVSEVVPREEAKARAGDLAQAQRMVAATQRILASIQGTNPLTDVADNAKKTIAGAISDAEGVLKIGGISVVTIVIVAAIIYVVVLARTAGTVAGGA